MIAEAISEMRFADFLLNSTFEYFLEEIVEYIHHEGFHTGPLVKDGFEMTLKYDIESVTYKVKIDTQCKPILINTIFHDEMSFVGATIKYGSTTIEYDFGCEHFCIGSYKIPFEDKIGDYIKLINTKSAKN